MTWHPISNTRAIGLADKGTTHAATHVAIQTVTWQPHRIDEEGTKEKERKNKGTRE
jgi:hypothetical protein